MVIRKFLRTDSWNYSKLGLRRKKKQVYRRAKGGENKMRLRMKGNPRNINIGFRTERDGRDLMNGLKPVMIYNVSDLSKIKSSDIGVIAKIGNKKRIEIANVALEKKIKLANLNLKKFTRKLEYELKQKIELKSLKENKKKEKIKKEVEKKETKVSDNKQETKGENKQ